MSEDEVRILVARWPDGTRLYRDPDKQTAVRRRVVCFSTRDSASHAEIEVDADGGIDPQDFPHISRRSPFHPVPGFAEKILWLLGANGMLDPLLSDDQEAFRPTMLLSSKAHALVIPRFVDLDAVVRDIAFPDKKVLLPQDGKRLFNETIPRLDPHEPRWIRTGSVDRVGTISSVLVFHAPGLLGSWTEERDIKVEHVPGAFQATVTVETEKRAATSSSLGGALRDLLRKLGYLPLSEKEEWLERTWQAGEWTLFGSEELEIWKMLGERSPLFLPWEEFLTFFRSR